MSILDQIVDGRRRDLASYGPCLGREVPPERARGAPAPFVDKKCVVLEIKRASPSKGDIAPSLDAEKTALAYIQAGAGAISVLTEPHHFKGSLDDLMAVGRTVDSYRAEHEGTGPAVLRKDFLVSPEEVSVSYRAGADAILLISRILTERELCDMAVSCTALGMTAFIELRLSEDVAKLRAVLSAVGEERRHLVVCGVNARDLSTFSIDLLRPCAMLPELPDVHAVFESGVRTAEAAAFVGGLGFTGLLLGEGAARNPSCAPGFVSSFVGATETANSRAWLSLSRTLAARKARGGSFRPLVKVCGLTSVEDALYAAMGGADFLGFIFWAGTPRNTSAAVVRKVREILDEQYTKTCRDEHIFAAGQEDEAPRLAGVVVDCLSDEGKTAISLVREGVLDFLQLHGARAVEQFYADGSLRDLPHYCVVNVATEDDLDAFDALRMRGEPRILVDAKAGGAVGGTGARIAQGLLERIQKKTALWLAGGIGPENLESVLSSRPELIDVNSGVESSPGVKDTDALMRLFSRLDGLCAPRDRIGMEGDAL